MEKVTQKRYECYSGYVVDDEGMYQIGEDIPTIGAVQTIEDIEDDEAQNDNN